MQKQASQRPRHIIRLTHIPYGFFEKELHGYFSQFGKIKKVRVERNKRGHHNGIAFVEFENREVAEIAAQTMDNYLLAESRIRCKVWTGEYVPKCIHKGRLFAKVSRIGENSVKHAKMLSAHKSEEQEKRQREKMVQKLHKRMAKLREQGINYTFDFEKKLEKYLENEGKLEGRVAEDELQKEESKEEKEVGKTSQEDGTEDKIEERKRIKKSGEGKAR